MKRHLGGGDQVAPPYRHPIEAEPVGDGVDEPLTHKAALKPAGRPIGRRRRLVGQPKMPDAAVGRDAVRPRQHREGHLHDPGAMGAHIGALVEIELILQRQDPPVGIDGDTGAMTLLARVVGGHQMLASVLDPFDRPPEAQRGDRDEEVFGVEFAPDAKSATGIAFLQDHRRRAATERARQRVAVAVRHLGGAEQFEHVPSGIEVGEGTPRLERYAAVPADRQVDGDDLKCRGKSCLDIAVSGAQQQHLGRQTRRKIAGGGAGVQ